ncbi:MAG TPA: M20 family metallopeptidase [Candidatus Desulfaltia sp.]|nr:M20 family metallopeptidase [Candidatus Desulfaltia sp.]
MADTDSLKKSVQMEVDALMPQLKKLKDEIGENPELGSEEYKSSKLLVEELRRHGFKVEHPFCEMDTAFKAVYKGKGEGPVIAILCEYDALPGVGHGCGHNIIGTAGVGAGIAVSKLMKDLPGDVWVVGTPAEEGHGPYGGAKVRMVNAGVFKDVDVSYMIHPMTGTSMVTGNFLAVSGVEIVFKGKTAHAAADAHNGLNALNAAVLTYMAIHANRQQLRRDANAVVHGIITEGGLASNIIPDKAALRFGVRSSDTSYVPTLVEMVVNSARGAAIATGCTMEHTVSTGLKSNLHNKKLESLYMEAFDDLGHEYRDPTEVAVMPPGGSTDFADVTHVVPGIHPMVGITQKEMTMHSREFADATMTPDGDKGLETGAKAMAMVTVELLANPGLLAEIKKEFEEKRL